MLKIESIIRTLYKISQGAIKKNQLIKRRGAKTGLILGGTMGLGFFLHRFGGKRHRNQDQGNY